MVLGLGGVFGLVRVRLGVLMVILWPVVLSMPLVLRPVGSGLSQSLVGPSFAARARAILVRVSGVMMRLRLVCGLRGFLTMVGSLF
ncbi:hypothetical protein D9R17_06160 [Corynebacterium diphtheriae]|nr:hypothetical protein D9B36_05550 [Corynebacterium diphtheriae]RLP09452.1 hypothetical protein D9R17_06160 [Corynebacterium diphtheriae]